MLKSSFFSLPNLPSSRILSLKSNTFTRPCLGSDFYSWVCIILFQLSFRPFWTFPPVGTHIISMLNLCLSLVFGTFSWTFSSFKTFLLFIISHYLFTHIVSSLGFILKTIFSIISKFFLSSVTFLNFYNFDLYCFFMTCVIFIVSFACFPIVGTVLVGFYGHVFWHTFIFL